MTRPATTIALGYAASLMLGPATVQIAQAQTPSAAASPVGDWRVADGSAVIRFERCGEALCGRIVQLRDDARALDEANPIRTLRSRPVCGLTILTALRPRNDGRWTGGRLYDPESGYTLRGISLQRREDGLRVSIGSGLFAGSETWRGLSAPVTPCAGG